jgi:hypothetical protein
VALGVDAVLDAVQQPRVPVGADLGVAELLDLARLHDAAELHRHGLHAVADAEHRHAERPDHIGRPRGSSLGDRLRPAGQDDSLGSKGTQRGGVHVPGVDLAVDAELAHAPGDQLRVLRAEVEDQDAVGVDIGGHRLTCGARPPWVEVEARRRTAWPAARGRN